MEQPSPPRPWHHAAILLWMLGFLVVIELALEWRAHQRGYDTLLFSKERASDATSTSPFRNPPIASERTSDLPLIWLMGASHAEDSYMPVDTIFPNLICHQPELRCALINASSAGADIDENLSIFQQYASEWQPDYVLLYQGSIEIQLLSKLAFGAPEAVANADTPSFYQQALNQVRSTVEATTVFSHLTQELRTRLMAAKPLHDAIPEPVWQIFRQRLQRVIDAAREQGAEPVLLTFAARYRADQREQFSDELFRSQLRYNPHLSRQGWLQSIARLNQEISTLAEQQGLQLIELADSTSGQASFFRDFSHFTREGHQHVAEQIAERLKLKSPQLTEVSR